MLTVEQMWTLDSTAVALGAFRMVGDQPRNYTATTFPSDPYAGCEQFIRTCRKLGYLRPIRTDADISGYYAVLDVLDRYGDIVQDFAIPTATAFRYIYRKLNLRLERAGR